MCIVFLNESLFIFAYTGLQGGLYEASNTDLFRPTNNVKLSSFQMFILPDPDMLPDVRTQSSTPSKGSWVVQSNKHFLSLELLQLKPFKTSCAHITGDGPCTKTGLP
ncbi:unnamed protein product [Lepidochelys kempii]